MLSYLSLGNTTSLGFMNNFGPLAVVLFLIALCLAAVVFWVWMLIDCLSNEPSEGNEKIVWLLVIILLQIFGAALYFFVRRPQRQRKAEE